MAYRQSIVTFLDILGFRNIVRDQGFDDIQTMLDLVGEAAGLAEKSTKVLSFSDSIIRARHTNQNTMFEDLLYEVKSLAQAQWALLEHGILVRGGVTVGKVAIGPGRAFGPAFVRAYDLESSLAGAPRIVLDPAVVQTIREVLRLQSGRTKIHRMITDLKCHVRLGEDGLWAVDYIGSIASTIKDQPEFIKTLLRYRNTIISKANALDATSPILPKFLWLIRYHNARSKELLPTATGLKIKSSDVPASDELLKPRLVRSAK